MTEKRCGTCDYWVRKEDDKYRFKCRVNGKDKCETDGKSCFCWKQRGC